MDLHQPTPTPDRRQRPISARLLACVLFGLLSLILIESMEAGWLLFSEGSIEIDTRTPEDRTSGWRGFLRRRRKSTAVRVGKNHELVKRAFREATAPANEATVRVFVGKRQVALGTIVASDGYVVTKATEVKAAEPDLACVLSDGRRKKAVLTAANEELDLALLKLNVADLTAARFAAPHMPLVGSWVAVANSAGELPLVVGVVSSSTRQIKRDNAVLGVLIEDATPGPRVQFVVPASSAAQIGLRLGDKVTHVNGEAMESREELIQYIRRYRPGDAVQLKILRAGHPLELAANLGRSTELNATDHGARQHAGGPLSVRRSGFPRVIQHDCLVYPENCGGPLVNLDGEVIGINIARAGRAESYALPADEIQRWVTPLLPRVTAG